MQEFVFIFLSVVILLSCVYVVFSKNLVLSVLFLVVILVATATCMAILGNSFLASVYVMVYVAGVIVLILFGIMLTKRSGGLVVLAPKFNFFMGITVGLSVLGVLIYFKSTTIEAHHEWMVTVKDMGIALLQKQMLTLEVVGVLLLVVLIFAAKIAAKDKS